VRRANGSIEDSVTIAAADAILWVVCQECVRLAGASATLATGEGDIAPQLLIR
jgi:hypothetical protein